MTAAAPGVKPIPKSVTIDVSGLKTYAFGSATPLFWGVVCLCLIEGTSLALLFTSYFYLRGNFYEWPPSARMPWIVGSVSCAVLVASMGPMWLTRKAAMAMDLEATQRWQLISTVVGAAALALRAWEIHTLPFQWTENAYASVVWVSLGLHALDFIVEMGEMVVLTVLVFKGPLEKKHFEDIEVNALFWAFLVVGWLPFAAVFYIDGAIR